MTATPVATGFSGSGLLNGNGNGNGRPRHQNLVIGAGPRASPPPTCSPSTASPRRCWRPRSQVGGLAKTVERDGYRFDLGGHRFFTKSEEVEALWHEVLDDEFLLRPRMSRIYWNGRFLDYPLRGTDVIRKLGPVELTRASLSYLRAAMKPQGRRGDLRGVGVEPLRPAAVRAVLPLLHREGVGCADQRDPRRVGGAADQGPVVLERRAGGVLRATASNVKSLIGEFHYPRFGPGQMWEAMTRPDRRRRRRGAARLAGVERIADRGRTVVVEVETAERVLRARARDLVAAAARRWSAWRDPLPPDDVVGRGAGPALPRLPDRRAGRSTARTSSPTTGSTSTSPDVRVGPHPELPLVEPLDGPGRRQGLPRAGVLLLRGRRPLDDGRRRPGRSWRRASWSSSGWPTPARSSAATSCACRRHTRCTTPTTRSGSRPSAPGSTASTNLQQVGRNGLHRYNNSDHSSLTAIRAVENLLDGAGHDIWAVNAESVYHEEDVPDEQPYREAPATPTMDRPLVETT